MPLPPLKVTLTPREGPVAVANYPSAAMKPMRKGWKRWFSRLGALGARLYAKEHQPGLFECALWVANAHAGVGILDWLWIRVAAPAGFAIVALPQAGNAPRASNTDPLLIGDGSVQCFPTRRGFVQRFALVDLALASSNDGLDVLQGSRIAIPDVVRAFGPLDIEHPFVNRELYHGLALQDVDALRAALANGTSWAPKFPGLDFECGIMHPAYGRWMFIGPASPGNPGGGNPAGSDIRLEPGYDQSSAGALLERERMDLTIARMVHAWDPLTGDYLTVEDLGFPSPQYSGSRTVGVSDAELPGYILPGVGASSCPYRALIEEPSDYLPSHLFRKGNAALVASEHIGDAVAHDVIIDTAEEARLSFSDHGPIQTDPAHWQPKNLANFFALQVAGNGGDCGRYRAEGGWFVAMAHRLAPRPAYKRWARLFQAWARKCQMANGLWQWSTDPAFGMPPGIAGAQMFEQVYFAHTLAALHDIAPVASTPAMILRAVDAMMLNRKLPPEPDPWHAQPGPTMYGPPHFLAVGDANGPFPTITWGKGSSEGPGIGDPSNCEPLLALAYRLSGAEKYLRASTKYGWPASSMSKKLEACNAALDKNWTASLEQALEEYLGVTA